MPSCAAFSHTRAAREEREEQRRSRVEARYQALLAVSVVLNSQRDSHSLFREITEQLKKVIPWERAGITIYLPEQDAFRLYAMETHLPKVILQPDMLIPRKGSAIGWVYEHKQVHIRPYLQQEQLFLEDQWYAQEGLGRMINVPLLVQNTCFGTHPPFLPYFQELLCLQPAVANRLLISQTPATREGRPPSPGRRRAACWAGHGHRWSW